MSDSTQRSNKPEHKKGERNRSNRNRSDQKKGDRKKSDRKNFRSSPPKQRSKKRKSNSISDHFSKRDFLCKESGEFKVSLGLVGALEELRSKVKKRITIVKGFESVEVAEKKGKLKRNFHTQGLAADIQIEGLSIQESFVVIETVDAFSGIGINFKEDYIHVETRKTERRCWVEESNEDIELTNDNKHFYLEVK